MFRRYTPFTETFGADPQVINLKMVGMIMVIIAFLCMGVYSLVMSSQVVPKQRRTMSYIFGVALVLIAFALMFLVVGVWVNYAKFDAYLWILAGTVSMGALLYLPWLAKATLVAKTIHEANEKLEESIHKLEQVKEIGEKVITSNQRHDDNLQSP
jgi:uncharacterized membrane protein YqjE